MLLNVFYEPIIECNAVTPWLQGALAAVEPLAENRVVILGRVFMDRRPEVGYLWLGNTLLGI